MLFAASVLACLAVASAQTGVIGINNCADIPGWVPSQALSTANEPVFSVGESGFSSLDTLSLVWYNPNKTDLVGASAFETPVAVGQPVCAKGVGVVTLPSGSQHNAECYNKCTYTLPFADLTAGGAIVIDTDPVEVVVRGKLFVNNTEDLGPIFRDQPQTIRVIESNFPFEITFPKTVTGTATDLEVFVPPGLAAALVLQSVNVDVVDLSVDGTVLIRTQFQWPFKFKTAGFAINAQNGIPTTVNLKTDCVDPGVVDDTPADNGNVAPCDQIWEVKLAPNPNQCQLDGSFTITNLAVECQAAFTSGGANCPVDDSQSPSSIGFTLDSEDYCPKLIEQIELTASLIAYKDAGFTVPATNYLLGDRIFFQAIVNSPLVSLSTATLQTMSIDFQGQGSILQYDVNNPGLSPQVVGWSLDNNGATTLSFAFDLTQGPFQPPVDGDQDFNVNILIDVTYVAVNPGNPLLLEERRVLLQADSSASKRASTSGSLAGIDEASSASTLAAAGLATAATVAALFA